jgi:hypothetical protein
MHFVDFFLASSEGNWRKSTNDKRKSENRISVAVFGTSF